MVLYSVTTDLWKKETQEEIPCFGIVGRHTNGEETEEIRIPAISINRGLVEEICERLLRNEVSLVHMRDVIEDTLWEREEVPFADISQMLS